ncbi:MAG: carboxypeptidase regulatory-like domain-containing protein [Candidatus Hydrogenedentes bacterium]|nr:carboxypeptidase regulatory-like domain-containing protein [Candidatus Hydrogenedentota bacterium]
MQRKDENVPASTGTAPLRGAHPRPLLMPLLVLGAGLVLAGCGATRIEGRVVDVKGDALPGVAVSVEGSSYQALTNGLGEYRIKFRPGRVVLHFAKTGYTPGILEAQLEAYRPVLATPVELWPLPGNAGVHIFENYRYRATKPVQPDAFVLANGEVVFGTQKWPELETADQEPVIICHNMPRYGVKLTRLDLAEVILEEAVAGSDTVTVWKPSRAVPVSVVPIDEPDALLLHVRFTGPLEPGTYALHWGALEGQARPEGRIFLFSVGRGPIAPAGQDDAAEGDAAGDDRGDAAPAAEPAGEAPAQPSPADTTPEEPH